GYKAWAGLGWLAISALSEVIAEDSKTIKAFNRASMVSDLSLQMADTNLSLESYNLGVTRYARVRGAVRALLGQGPLASVTGLGARQDRRSKRADRVIGRQELANRVLTLVSNSPENMISSDDVDMIADKFGFSEAEQDEIFDGGGALASFMPFAAPIL